MSVKGVQKS